MFGKWFAAGVLTTAGVLAFALPVRAGDTHRLSLTAGAASTPTLSLVDDGKSADTVDVRWGGGFRGGYGGYRGGYGYHGGYGGYRGGYGGYYGGYRGGYYGGFGGYRGGYYGGYRGGYGGYYGGYRGGYGGYYGGYGYYPSYYGSAYYYAAPVYYYSPPVYYGGSCLYPSAGATAPTLSLSVTSIPRQVVIDAPPTLRQPAVEFVAPPAGGPTLSQPIDPTFPYDGGPRTPAPMPKADPAPDLKPSAAPLDGRSVSLPSAKAPGKLAYPAYGEPMNSPVAPRIQDRVIVVKGDPGQK